MTLPNFIIIGAPKSGSTALNYCLRQHPQIFICHPKEPNHFALSGTNLNFVEPDGSPALVNKSPYADFESYRDLFKSVTDQRAVGEASVMYLGFPGAAERIHRCLPDAKLIAMLRDPVESAFSEFTMNKGFGIEPCDNLLDAVRDQQRRIGMNCINGLYINDFLHYKNVCEYRKYFPDQQIRIYLNEDFRNNRNDVLRDIFQFLDVDRSFKPELPEAMNTSGAPTHILLHRLLTIRTNPLARKLVRILPPRARFLFLKIRNWNLTRQTLSAEHRFELISYFEDDILQLQEHLQRDLSHWLN